MALRFIDLRDELPRAAWSIGRRDDDPLGGTLHFNGPPVAGAGTPALEIAQLRIDARYHMRADVLGADGIQYTYAALSDGRIGILRDDHDELWHCANRAGNRAHVAVHIPIGGAQRPTAPQWQATCELFDHLIAKYRWPGRHVVLGHREWPRSDGKPQKPCPGPILFRMLQEWRGALATTRRYQVNTALMNVRQGPGVEYKVAGQMRAGEDFLADALVANKKNGQLWAHRVDGLGFSLLELLRLA